MFLGEGDDFAGYRILQTLGSGGMGDVYLAQHPRLPRREALKLLRSDISADPDYRSRFEREAALASTLWHPNIVGLHDRGEFDGHLWITMDFVDGNNAAELLATKYPDGLPKPLVMQIVSAVAGALDYAHKQGLLHRDVKPANIIVTNIDDDGQSRVLLADFGIARHIDEVSGLTATNMTVGTVAYAAPEQLMGEHVDGRADQYALAATAYQLLTGSQLYPHSNAAVVIGRHLNADPPRLADGRPDLASLDPAFAVALSKDPGQRFARVSDFAAALTDPDTAGPHHFASAPTQTAPVTPRPPAGPPTQDAPARGRTRRAILAAAAVLTAVAVAAALAVWHPWDHTRGGSPAVPVAAPPNSGPFTGVYTADFGPEIELGTGKGLNGETARATLHVRSACTPTGCRAIANVDGPTINRSLIFDQIGDKWVAVATSPSSSPLISKGLKAGCEQGLSPEVWESVSLKVQFDGPLSGDYEVADANNCNTSRTMNLTRTGDVDLATMDDPADLPPRKPLPASGFRGQYHYSHTVGSRAPVGIDGSVTTYCLRTVARCTSYFYTISSAEPFVFTDGQWVMHYKGPTRCGSPTAPRITVDRSAILELPSPPTDPITALSGSGHEQVDDAGCVASEDFQLHFERIGD